jgi:hypothetical protein
MQLGNSPSNHRPSSPIIKSWKTFENLVFFSLQDVLEGKKIQKWQEKFYEVGQVSAQRHMFFVPKSVIVKHIHFSFAKHFRKT